VTLLDRAAEVRAEHLPELREVVERQRRVVHADEAAAVAHEVHERLPLRLAHGQVAVRHHHDPVELRQVRGRDHRQVELVTALQVALERRHLEAVVRAPRGDRGLGVGEARVLVEARVREEEELLRRLLGGRRRCE
jgi:hypothetical protein